MRIYLDTCCYNRPFDDQSLLSVFIETQAKLQIQDLIKNGDICLAVSYVLKYENSQNPSEAKRNRISAFIEKYFAIDVSYEKHESVEKRAVEIISAGIREYDAYHVACAMIAECDFLISTDKRLLKYQNPEIELLNPIEFINFWEEH